MSLACFRVHSDTPATSVAKAGWKPVPPSGVISSSGNYYLERDVRTGRQIGIHVMENDVVIDLRGHALRYSGAPREGVFGIVANGQKRIAIRNGAVGAFWFNMHLVQCENVTIENMQFDDIAYIGINVAESRDVNISRNHFTNFRFDIGKPKDKYLIGINIGAEDAVIANNSFHASPRNLEPQAQEIETVFVLFSAIITQRCMVVLNQMKSDHPLPKSYGVWIAQDGQATIAYNEVRNMKYAFCLATDASATICHNRVSSEVTLTSANRDQTYGVYAQTPKALTVVDNTFQGLSDPVLMPEKHIYRNNAVE